MINWVSTVVKARSNHFFQGTRNRGDTAGHIENVPHLSSGPVQTVFLIGISLLIITMLFRFHSVHDSAIGADMANFPPKEKAKSIEATAFVLVDDKGQRRAQLGFAGPNGNSQPTLCLFDEKNKIRAELSISPSGFGNNEPIPRIALHNSDGDIVLEGRVDVKGNPAFQATGKDGSYCSFGVGPGNQPTITMNGGLDHRDEACLRFVPGKVCFFDITDPDGVVRSSFSVNYKKGVTAQFYDTKGKEIWKAP